MKILVVDDDKMCRKYMLKVLKKYGKCDYAADGVEALDAFKKAVDRNEPYDLICLDIMMPNLDGINTLKAIREIEKNHEIYEINECKIIMTTSLNDTETIMETYDSGCEAFLAKPVNTEQLLQIMKKLRILK